MVRTICVAVSILCWPSAAAFGATRYVSAACGDDTWTGLSAVCAAPDGPKKTIQAALNASVSDDKVVVMDGSYTGSGNRDLDFQGKALTVRSENGPSNCVIDCENAGRGFYLHSGEGAASVVDGLTIRNGRAVMGGAVFCLGSDPTIQACRFIENTASGNLGNGGGGAIAVQSGDPDISGCTISGNTAPNSPGGGIFCTDGSNPLIRDCTISDNSTGWGGGGVQIDSGSSPTLINSRFVQNDAFANGGGLYIIDGCSPWILDCSFIANSAGHVGGGVSMRDDCNPVLANCLFDGNSAQDYGGGLRAGFDTNPTLVNCTFSGNVADQAGGAVSTGSNNPDPLGEVRLHNCILWDNVAPLGAEAALIGDYPAAMTVSYCDVRGGQAAVYVQNGFTLAWGGGNIDADPGFADPDGADELMGTSDDDFRLLDGSPCIDAGDNSMVPLDELDVDADGDVREPLPFDFDGLPRFVQDPQVADTGVPGSFGPPIVDMGAYEVQSAYGDIDHDGDIDLDDYLGLSDCLSGPGATPSPGAPGLTAQQCLDAFDADADADVDLRDCAPFMEYITGSGD